ncbi:toll/interleukin-1 receptor domain-containing protein, partial [Candidatus Frankia nodulisporulans]
MRGPAGQSTAERPAVDCFLSYVAADEPWATWIAHVLEERGQSVAIKAWDVVPGTNIVAWTSVQMQNARRTIAVCSPSYFGEYWNGWEWGTALAERTLVPLRISDVPMPGLLRAITFHDLFGVSEEVARRRVLEAVGLERVARVADGFPGDPPETTPARAPALPTADDPAAASAPAGIP